MGNRNNRWKSLFLFCLGLALGATLCMKWLETGFEYSGGRFGIVGLEASYDRMQIQAVLGGLSPLVREALKNHLYFDFAFMAGVYPGIAALLMMAGDRISSPGWRKILLVLAALQTLAWTCDVLENRYLLNWVNGERVPADLSGYHLVVYLKWGLALTGLLVALLLLLRRKKKVA